MKQPSPTLSHRVPGSPARAVPIGAVALLLGLVLGLVGLPPASAGATAAPSGTGWIRMGHLSPGTGGVDVRLSPFAGGGPTDLTDIEYGQFSDYARVPAGLYTVAVRPTGSALSVQPMIDESVEVSDGGAATVIATPSGEGVVARVVQDDLTPPESGDAKVRLISGAVQDETVSAQVVGGPLLAEDLVPGADTGYAAVPGRTWSVELLVDGASNSVNQVPLRAGAVYTLLVVDGPGETLGLQAVQDSASSSVMPMGGVDTGGGALAGAGDVGAGSWTSPAVLAGLAGLVGLVGLAGFGARARVRIRGDR